MSYPKIPDFLLYEISIHHDLVLEKNYNMTFILRKNNLFSFIKQLKKDGYDEDHPLYKNYEMLIINIIDTIKFLNKCSTYTAEQLIWQSQLKDVEIPIFSLFTKDFIIRFFTILFDQEKITVNLFLLKFY